MTHRFINIETEGTDRCICIYHISHYYEYNHDRVVIVMTNSQSFRALGSMEKFEEKLRYAFYMEKGGTDD